MKGERNRVVKQLQHFSSIVQQYILTTKAYVTKYIIIIILCLLSTHKHVLCKIYLWQFTCAVIEFIYFTLTQYIRSTLRLLLFSHNKSSYNFHGFFFFIESIAWCTYRPVAHDHKQHWSILFYLFKLNSIVRCSHQQWFSQFYNYIVTLLIIIWMVLFGNRRSIIIIMGIIFQLWIENMGQLQKSNGIQKIKYLFFLIIRLEWARTAFSMWTFFFMFC